VSFIYTYILYVVYSLVKYMLVLAREEEEEVLAVVGLLEERP
jgi:hypothetical protein